jgi:N-acetylglucosaminyl-diphospho-decaprenol L-rhamnosyltransferase
VATFWRCALPDPSGSNEWGIYVLEHVTLETAADGDASGAPPDLSVVIITYNSVGVLGDLLGSLPAALTGISAEVLVVDNGSSDGTAEFAENHGGCRVIRSSNVGYAAGLNLGVRLARRAEAILVLNADVRLHEGSVPLLLKALQAPGVGIVAPQVRSPTGEVEPSLRRAPSLLRAIGLNRTKMPIFSEYITKPSDYSSPRDVEWALGAVLLMSRRCYEMLGGWDESFFLYSEETDFSLRARDAGLLTRYEPGAIAVHIGGHSGRNEKTHTMHILNRVRLYRRRHGATASWCYYAVTLVHEVTWIMRGRQESRASVAALLSPSRRPQEIGAAAHLMPR